ncbi:MAG: ribose-phosphate diphosphokinase [candidate division Zixibacteria bacterium]|nr:ribose-phosphate diphosphokinase [candidate division Zixibacteria bacterium]
MPDQIKLLTGTANLPLAERVANYIGIPLTQREIKHFSDGEIFVKIDENVRGTDVFIIQPTNPPAENIMELLIMIEACRRASASRITAVIPYYGYARQDRKSQPRVAITAKLLANLITAAGADRVVTMDLHVSQIQGFFDIPSDHLYASNLFYNHFKIRGMNDIVVVTPDVGSIKIARAFANSLQCGLAIIDKRRPEPNKSEVLNIIGDVKDKSIIIRDDMVDTAGTLCDAARAVLEKGGAKEVFACATHGVFSGESIQRIINSPIKELIITDTIDTTGKKLPDKIKVLTTAEIFGEAIRRISNKESISILFER